MRYEDGFKVEVLRYAKRYGCRKAAEKYGLNEDRVNRWRHDFSALCDIKDSGKTTQLKVVRSYEVKRQTVLKVACQHCGAIFYLIPNQGFDFCPSCQMRVDTGEE